MPGPIIVRPGFEIGVKTSNRGSQAQLNRGLLRSAAAFINRVRCRVNGEIDALQEVVENLRRCEIG